MAIETLERLQSGGSQITFPSIWTDFRFGHHAWRLGSAPDSKRFSITWHQEKISLDEQTFFYTTEEHRTLLGKIESRDTYTVREANYHHPDNGALYTGEWRVDRRVR